MKRTPRFLARGIERIKARLSKSLRISRMQILILAILTMMGIVSLLSPNFLTVQNQVNVLEQLSIDAVVAAGMTLVIISGGIDLSVGAVLALGSMGTAALMVRGIPIPIAIVAGVCVGLGIGAINGLAIAVGRVPAFVMTLGMMNIARGTVLYLTGGKSIWGFPEEFEFLAKGSVGPVPMLIIVTGAVYLSLHLLLTRTRFGRYTFAIGNSEEVSRLLGVRVRLHKLKLYALCSGMAVFSGILLSSRMNSAQTLAGTGQEMDVIAAVVIGGTSLYGGTGSMVGTLLGVYFLRLVHNSLNLLGVSPFLQDVSVGALLVLSALADVISHRLRK
jgi:ribose transport system permease protein